MPEPGGLAAQLARPSGWAGRAIAAAMDVANRTAVAACIDALDPRQGEHILDLGAGTGRAMRRMLARGARVTGIDHSPLMVERAARCVARYGAAASVMQADFAALPLADASVDAVLACNSLYFWHDEAAIVAELRRVMRPAARFVAYVTAAQAMREWGLGRAGQHRLFDAEQLRQIGRAVSPSPEIVSISSWGVAGLICRPAKERAQHADRCPGQVRDDDWATRIYETRRDFMQMCTSSA